MDNNGDHEFDALLHHNHNTAVSDFGSCDRQMIATHLPPSLLSSLDIVTTTSTSTSTGVPYHTNTTINVANNGIPRSGTSGTLRASLSHSRLSSSLSCDGSATATVNTKATTSSSTFVTAAMTGMPSNNGGSGITSGNISGVNSPRSMESHAHSLHLDIDSHRSSAEASPSSIPSAPHLERFQTVHERHHHQYGNGHAPPLYHTQTYTKLSPSSHHLLLPTAVRWMPFPPVSTTSNTVNTGVTSTSTMATTPSAPSSTYLWHATPSFSWLPSNTSISHMNDGSRGGNNGGSSDSINHHSQSSVYDHSMASIRSNSLHPPPARAPAHGSKSSMTDGTSTYQRASVFPLSPMVDVVHEPATPSRSQATSQPSSQSQSPSCIPLHDDAPITNITNNKNNGDHTDIKVMSSNNGGGGDGHHQSALHDKSMPDWTPVAGYEEDTSSSSLTSTSGNNNSTANNHSGTSPLLARIDEEMANGSAINSNARDVRRSHSNTRCDDNTIDDIDNNGNDNKSPCSPHAPRYNRLVRWQRLRDMERRKRHIMEHDAISAASDGQHSSGGAATGGTGGSGGSCAAGGMNECHEQANWLWTIWHRPSLIKDWDSLTVEDHRRTSWSELYFDLILTSVFARLGDALRRGTVEDVESATNERPFGLLEYSLFFAIIWIFWQSLIRYNNGFHTDDLFHKLFQLCFMCGVVGLGMHINGGLSGARSTAFIVSAAFLHMLLCVAYLRVAYHIKRTRVHAGYFAIWEAVQACLWCAAFNCSSYNRWIIYWCGIGADTIKVVSLVNWLPHRYRLPLHLDHWIERFGLLTIIVLGEAVSSLAVEPKSDTSDIFMELYLVVALAFFFTSSLKMLYFDVDTHALAGHAATVRYTGLAWAYIHLTMLGAIAVIGSGLRMLIDPSINLSPDDSLRARWYLSGGAAIFLATVIIERLLHERPYIAINNIAMRATLWRLYWLQIVTTGIAASILSVMPIVMVTSATSAFIGMLCGIALILVVIAMIDEAGRSVAKSCVRASKARLHSNDNNNMISNNNSSASAQLTMTSWRSPTNKSVSAAMKPTDVSNQSQLAKNAIRSDYNDTKLWYQQSDELACNIASRGNTAKPVITTTAKTTSLASSSQAIVAPAASTTSTDGGGGIAIDDSRAPPWRVSGRYQRRDDIQLIDSNALRDRIAAHNRKKAALSSSSTTTATTAASVSCRDRAVKTRVRHGHSTSSNKKSKHLVSSSDSRDDSTRAPPAPATARHNHASRYPQQHGHHRSYTKHDSSDGNHGRRATTTTTGVDTRPFSSAQLNITATAALPPIV